MPSFEFSYIANLPTGMGDSHLLDLVDEYNHQYGHLPAQVASMGWADAWQQLMRVAIYKKGPSLSEIGAPWTSDFVGMNSLRTFQPNEIERLGGDQAFAPGPWRNCSSSADSHIWGIPARVDARVIFYWKDMLDQANLDPATAFSTPAQFEDSLARLQAAGIERPLTLISDATRDSVYLASTWIWAAGGEVIDPLGKLAFQRQAAQDGLIAFFKLHRYLANPSVTPSAHFLQRKSAVTYHNLSVYNEFKAGLHLPWSEENAGLLGAALPPGPAFVGGTNLVIWQHASQLIAQGALELIAALVTKPRYIEYCLNTGFLPARQEALNLLRSQGDERLQVLVRALETGRTGSSAHVWVLVAERLGAALGGIWNALRQEPDQDVGDLVMRMTRMAAARLEQSLS